MSTQHLTEFKKHNAAIHVDTRALTITHRKAFNILLWNAWDEISDNKMHSIGAWELCEMLGFHNISKLKTEMEKLPFIKVEWNILREDGWPIDMGVCGLISGFRMTGNRFEYSFFEGFRPHLSNPSLWTKIKIEIANLFNSSYALALYENCNRYASKKFGEERSTGFKDVDEWRKLLGIPSTGTYKSFAVVHQKIIKPAVKQVNELADITIKPEYLKKGRGGALSQLRFSVSRKNGYRLPERQKELPGLSKQILAEQITRFAPGENPAQKWLEDRRAGKISPPSTQFPLLPD